MSQDCGSSQAGWFWIIISHEILGQDVVLGLQSSEGLTEAGGSASWNATLFLDLVQQVIPERARKAEATMPPSDPVSGVTRHHFHYILFTGNGSLSTDHTKGGGEE